MPEVNDEPFSNPLPPPAARRESEDSDAGVVHMTNKDFRQLLMTPRSRPGEAPPSSRREGERHTDSRVVKEYNEDDDPRARRRKKKSFYAKLKKQEMEKEAELARKYRDRAKERREGKTDYDEGEVGSTTANYRAVAPDAKHDEGAANRRRQLIEESKYLGGDMEHTHLVKGLDYALLQKVRAEITTKEKTDEDEMEMSFQNTSKEQEIDDSAQFKTRMARNVYRTLFKNNPPKVNELFLPGRMAYQVELEDEYAESDIPTTIIRSKADCPTLESHTNLTTNDIVINKLTQILSYLRQGQRNRKMKKKDKNKAKEDKAPVAEENIFGDIGNYVPDFNKRSNKERERSGRDYDRSNDRRRDDDRRRGEEDRRRGEDDRKRGGDRERGDRERGDRERRPRSYFEKPKGEEEEPMNAQGPTSSASDFVKKITEKYSSKAPEPSPAPAPIKEERFAGTLTSAELKAVKKEKEKGIALQGASHQRGKSKGSKVDSYMECYPGAMEMADALDDSDEEADYTKMDMGNKKGPVGRWDFETTEEYSTYMNQKEAMPKAAFQFGIKMSEGRKTRRMFTEKNEKAQLDREWQQISQIISKRKAGSGGGGGGEKKAKY